MRGFEVVTSDDRLVGHVADVRDGYLIVESGHVRKADIPCRASSSTPWTRRRRHS